jgi:ribosomal protein S8
MTTLITLELSDDVVQQLQAEAQKQNTTLEKLAIQRIVQPNNINPKIQNSPTITEEHLDQEIPLAQMCNRIYEANQTGLDRIQATATPLTRQIADSLLRQKIIDRIEIDEIQPNVMTLYLPEHPLPTPQFGIKNYLQDFSADDPELIPILQKLQNPDPNIRIQAINALGERCRELA